jgi:putative transport protein
MLGLRRVARSGKAGGLLVSGVILSSVTSRFGFFGNTPATAHNVLEDLGLVAFVAIVGINAATRCWRG